MNRDLADLIAAAVASRAPIDGRAVDADTVEFVVNGASVSVAADALEHLGDRLQGVLDVVNRVADEAAHLAAEETERRKAEQARTWSPAEIGLVEHDGRWRRPVGAGAVGVERNPDVGTVTLSVFADGADDACAAVSYRVGDEPNRWWPSVSIPAMSVAQRRVSPYSQLAAIDDETRERLLAAFPLAGEPLEGVSLGEVVGVLLERSETLQEWSEEVHAAHGAAEAAKAARDEERAEATREWRRKSRGKDRIPNKAIDDWARAKSHVEYTRDGVATSGWRVDVIPVDSERRPEGVEDNVGVKEILRVVRLQHVDARYRRRRTSAGLRFYDSDLTSLRETLPDCVVKAPEDGAVVFVAVNTPDAVEILDGALATWVLTGGDPGDD